MDTVFNESVITANGEYSFERFQPGGEVEIEWDITAGSCAVEAGYVGMSGEFKPDRDLAANKPVFGPEGGRIKMGLPHSGRAAIRVSGAAGLSMIVCLTQLP